MIPNLKVLSPAVLSAYRREGGAYRKKAPILGDREICELRLAQMLERIDRGDITENEWSRLCDKYCGRLMGG